MLALADSSMSLSGLVTSHFFVCTHHFRNVRASDRMLRWLSTDWARVRFRYIAAARRV